MKKRVFALFLAMSLAFTTVACGAGGDDKESSSSDVEKSLKKANKLMDDEEWEDAAEIYEEILDEDEECAEAYIGLAECYVNMDDMKKAEKTLSKGLKNTEGKDKKKIQKAYDKYFGDDADEDDDDTSAGVAADPAPAPEEPDDSVTTAYGGDVSDGGKVINIYVWNEEFKTRVAGDESHEPFMPGYRVIDATTGEIDGVRVNWIINSSEGNNYQNKLDAQLERQLSGSLADDEKIDIFLAESDYILKYTASDATVPMTAIGLSNSTFSNQFQYTKDIGTFNGELKAVSWQCCPSVLIYNRSIAKKVLGSDDPDTVQDAVCDWSTYMDTAALMKKKGYMMNATVFDTYRAYIDGGDGLLIRDGRINVDNGLSAWADMAKEEASYGVPAEDIWGDTWNLGFSNNKVFCYIGPAWFYNYCMDSYNSDSIASKGGWGVVQGPSASYWGGTWILVANGTDNASIDAKIIQYMTTDYDILYNISAYYGDFANDKSVMNDMANSGWSVNVLGGQNPLRAEIAVANSISCRNKSFYDASIREKFSDAMREYLRGQASYNEALDYFYDMILSYYPELSR